MKRVLTREFIARKEELEELQKLYKSDSSNLVVMYGRRRIGKSLTINHFAKKHPFFSFEGLEDENTPTQITHFTDLLKRQTKDPILDSVQFKSWTAVFNYLTDSVLPKRKEKIILFLDEIQWMAAKQGKLIALLKYFWDNHWQNKNVMLILCGSIASYMVTQVIRSKALYGRISCHIHLKPFDPNDASKMFLEKRSQHEILLYLLIFGGIPKYLAEIQLHESLTQNLNRLCFSKRSPLAEEFQKVFYAQFKEPRIYLKIVKLLIDNRLTLLELSKHLKMPSGGGLKKYLNLLKDAGFIQDIKPFESRPHSKNTRYTCSDEYLIFYIKYIEPLNEMIEHGNNSHIFETLIQPKWLPWLGFAFERFCRKNSIWLAQKMGFGQKVVSVHPVYHRGEEGFQIDMVYKRSDQVITVCEIKYHQDGVGIKVIPELEAKIESLKIDKNWSIEKALITSHGAKKELHDSQYFHHIVNVTESL